MATNTSKYPETIKRIRINDLYADSIKCDDLDVTVDLKLDSGEALADSSAKDIINSDGDFLYTDGTTVIIDRSENSITATTLTDGTMSITGGDITSVGSITATTLTDGTMSITGGDITSVGSITATTLTDGTASLSLGALSGITTIDMTDDITGGEDTNGVNLTFYGDTTGKKVRWVAVDNMLDVDGIMKIHNRPVSTDTYALEVKTDYDQASGVGQGGFQCSTRVYPATDTTTIDARGGYFQCQLHADDTMTGGGMTGLYTQVHNNDTGILNGSGISIRSMHTDIADGGVWTEVGRVCSLHIDSHLSQAVSSGTFSLLFIQNSGTTTANSVIEVDANDKATALMTLTNVDGAAMTSNGSVLNDISSTANNGYIKVVVEGETKYIALYDLKA